MEGTAQEPGIIPRVAEYLFETKQASQISQVEIEMSYMEILKESVYDLLVPRDKVALSCLENHAFENPYLNTIHFSKATPVWT